MYTDGFKLLIMINGKWISIIKMNTIKRFIFKFHTLKSTLTKPITRQHSLLLGTRIAYGFSKQNLSSRQIDIKIHEQRWKNLQNNYKALKTSFGLKMPTSIPKDYPTPDRIQFNLESLRQCSNQYPEYLAEQLKKPDSRFYQVIDDELSNLWKADKKQALEMISFIVHWKIHLQSEEIGEMLLRTIKKMDLNLFEVFELLKIVLQEGQNNMREEGLEKQTQKSVIEGLDGVFKKFLVILQNKIVIRLQIIDPQEYQPLFKIINLLRLYDVYPQVKQQKKQPVTAQQKQQSVKQPQQQQQQPNPTQNQQQEQLSFFQIIQANLLKNLNQIPPSSLVIMAVHYANNTKQSQDQRIQILSKIEQKIIFNLKFFTHEELVAIMYSYMKTSLMGEEFTEQLVRRIRLIYSEMSWQNKKKILALSGLFPKHQRILILAQAHNQLTKGKPVVTKLQDGGTKIEYDPKVFIQLDFQLVPEIYLATYQNNLLTEELAKKMQQLILGNIYNLDREEVVRSVWLFTLTPNINDNLAKLHKKLQVIIQGGFQGGQYPIKDVSIIVWSLCNSGANNTEIYKPQAQFWNNIQFYLQQKLQKQYITKQEVKKEQNEEQQQKAKPLSQQFSPQSPLNDISSILWAYTFNRPLKFKTVLLISDIILEEMEKEHVDIHTFELINIVTFYYSLPKKAFPAGVVDRIKKLCIGQFQHLHQEMNYIQLMKCLKYLTMEEIQNTGNNLIVKLKVWENIVQTFEVQAEEIQYEHIMGVVGLLINSPLGRAKNVKVVKLVGRLVKRKKRLEQLRPVQDVPKGK